MPQQYKWRKPVIAFCSNLFPVCIAVNRLSIDKVCFGMLRKCRCNFLQCPRQVEFIGIQPTDDIAGALLESFVDGVGLPTVGFRFPEKLITRTYVFRKIAAVLFPFLQHFLCPVCRNAINQNMLYRESSVRLNLCQYAPEIIIQKTFVVVCWRNN